MRIVCSSDVLSALAFDCCCETIRETPTKFKGMNPQHVAKDDAQRVEMTCVRNSDFVYAKISLQCNVIDADDPPDAVICLFSGQDNQTFLYVLDFINRHILSGVWSEKKLAVVLLEHVKLFQPRRTNTADLTMFLAQHTKIGYRRFDVTALEQLATTLHQIIFCVHDTKIRQNYHSASVNKMSTTATIMSAVRPVLCMPDQTKSLQSTSVEAECNETRASPRTNPAVASELMDSGRVVIRWGSGTNRRELEEKQHQKEAAGAMTPPFGSFAAWLSSITGTRTTDGDKIE